MERTLFAKLDLMTFTERVDSGTLTTFPHISLFKLLTNEIQP